MCVFLPQANLRKIDLTQERTEIADSGPGPSGYAHRGRKRKEPSQELFEPETRNQERTLRARTELDVAEELAKWVHRRVEDDDA